MEYEIEVKIIPHHGAMNELEYPIEKIGNRVLESGFGSIKSKYKDFGPKRLVKSDKIQTSSSRYRKNIYDKIGHVANLLY